MHPNWKALSTVDFPRKQFVRPTEPDKRARDVKQCSSKNEATGDDVRNFYESVLASEAGGRPIKQEKDSNSRTSKKNRTTKSGGRVKNEFSDQLEPEDPTAFHKAFFAAQINDEDTLGRIFASLAISRRRELLSVRDGYDWTLLMVASCANAKKVVAFLVDMEGIELGARDRGGNTALDLAMKRGYHEIIQLIESRQKQTCRKNAASKTTKNASKTSENAEPSATTTSSFNCDVCEQTFENVESWKKHATSMVHLLNRSRDELEKGHLRAHFVIPEANRGYQMMLSGGWDKKSGLGPTGSGKLYPVKTVLKRDRTGLGLESESGIKVTPKVTHFDPRDVAGVSNIAKNRDLEDKIALKRDERMSTLSRKKQLKKMLKEKAKEVNFRREFSSL